MRLTSPAAHRPNARSGLRSRLASALLAAIGASGPAQAQYQPDSSIGTGGAMLPGPAGYQVGGGLDVPAAHRVGWWSETSITAQATLTNNANYGDVGAREGDLIIELTPAWNFHRAGARLRVDGFVSLDMIGYVEGTQTSRILPQANVLANLEAIENLFFIDGSIGPTSPWSIRFYRGRISRRPTTSTPMSRRDSRLTSRATSASTSAGLSEVTTRTRGAPRPTPH